MAVMMADIIGLVMKPRGSVRGLGRGATLDRSILGSTATSLLPKAPVRRFKAAWMIWPRRLLDRKSRREDPTESFPFPFPSFPLPCLSDSTSLRDLPTNPGKSLFPPLPPFPPSKLLRKSPPFPLPFPPFPFPSFPFPPFPSFPPFPALPPIVPSKPPSAALFPPGRLRSEVSPDSPLLPLPPPSRPKREAKSNCLSSSSLGKTTLPMQSKKPKQIVEVFIVDSRQVHCSHS